MLKTKPDIMFINNLISSADSRALDLLRRGEIAMDIKLRNEETIFHPIALENTTKHHLFLEKLLTIAKENGYLPQLLDTPDKDGKLPIHYALIKNNFIAAEMLLKQRATYDKEEVKKFLATTYPCKGRHAVDNFECWREAKLRPQPQEIDETQAQSVKKNYQTNEPQKSWIDNGLTLFKSIFISDTPPVDEGQSLINKYKKIN